MAAFERILNQQKQQPRLRCKTYSSVLRPLAGRAVRTSVKFIINAPSDLEEYK